MSDPPIAPRRSFLLRTLVAGGLSLTVTGALARAGSLSRASFASRALWRSMSICPRSSLVPVAANLRDSA